MNCAADHRDRVERAADALEDVDGTIVVETFSPAKSQHDRWTLDAVIHNETGVPPAVLRELALAGLTLRPTPSQAEH